VGHKFELPFAPKVLNAIAVIADLDIHDPPPLPVCSSSPKSIDVRGANALGAADKDEASSGVVHFNSLCLSCSLGHSGSFGLRFSGSLGICLSFGFCCSVSFGLRFSSSLCICFSFGLRELQSLRNTQNETINVRAPASAVT